MDKIIELQEIIRDSREEILLDTYAYLNNMVTSVGRTNDAREELERLDTGALDDVRNDLELIYYIFEYITGEETPTLE